MKTDLRRLGSARQFILLATIAVVAFASGPAARAVPAVVWNQDSNAGVSVTLTGIVGTGSIGLPTGNYLSPSSLWDLNFTFGGLFAFDPGVVEFSGGFIIGGSFLGASGFGFTSPGGFADYFYSLPASAADGIDAEIGPDWINVGQGIIGFSGTDFDNPSTWSYKFDVTILNPNWVPPESVPEGGATGLLAASALAVLLVIGRFGQGLRVRAT